MNAVELLQIQLFPLHIINQKSLHTYISFAIVLLHQKSIPFCTIDIIIVIYIFGPKFVLLVKIY